MMLRAIPLPSLLFTLTLVGCSSPQAPTPEPAPPAPSPPPVASSTPPPAPSTSDPQPEAPAAAGTPCGPLECRRFPDAASAFEVVLAEKPDVLAVGEAHAQKGTEHLASATSRFTSDLLPRLKGTTSHVVLELIDPPRGCQKAVAQTRKAQKPVVDKEAASNPNEFITLGKAAEKLGIRPRILTPDCERFQTIADAGPDGVIVMLEMIAKMTQDILVSYLARGDRQNPQPMLLAYGGAMHNDVKPREGREAWSFGPQLVEATSGRYVELDLIVPEYIKDNDTWRAFPWFEHFDRSAPPAEVTLFKTGEHSWVLVFGRSEAPE